MSLPLTLQDVLDDLAITVNRPDLSAGFPDAFNRAVRDCAAAHSFDQLKVTGSVTLPSGQNSVSLSGMDPNFKEPQNERFWVYGKIGASGAVQKIPVYSRGDLERLNSSFLPNPYLIYSQIANSVNQIGLFPGIVAADDYILTEVHYFAYPAPVTNPSEGTPLLTFYPNMVLARTRALIFQGINDPIWQEHDQVWKEEILRWTGVDMGVSRAGPYPEKE